MEHQIHSMYNRLAGKKVIPCTSQQMAVLYENSDQRIVSQENVGQFWISTVFLPTPHGLNLDQHFETMVFDRNPDSPDGDVYQDRYSTWDEAAAGHKKAVEKCKKGEFDG